MLQSCKMAQKCSVLFATSRNSVSDVEERSGPHASARSATDEWLKGLEGRWHSRLYINESQTNGRVIHLPPPLTYLSSFCPFPAHFRCSPIEWSCCKDKCDNIKPFLFRFHVRIHIFLFCPWNIKLLSEISYLGLAFNWAEDGRQGKRARLLLLTKKFKKKYLRRNTVI